ncbi:hypothetical protein H4582DRAFT_1827676 [Lactarius indigo]|nr:hypothetical protein H4582DRAFT_1827676 [Lactarius indigo]
MSVSPFSAAHRRYVKSLYKRMLENERNWVVRYDFWRARACAVRAEFERNRNVHDPRALAAILEKAEEELARKRHPDPYIRASSQSTTTPLSLLRPLTYAFSPRHSPQLLHFREVQSGTWRSLRLCTSSLLTSVLFFFFVSLRERNAPVRTYFKTIRPI